METSKLEGARRGDLKENIRDFKVGLIDASIVKDYVDDLKALLNKGSIVERKSFLRSFSKRIEVNLPQIIINYTNPLETRKVEVLTREVLSVNYAGSSGRTRTYNPPVNRQI